MIDLQTFFYWSVTIIAVIGVTLNIKKSRKCFYIWAFTNSAFAIETFIFQAYNMTLLFIIYFVLAIWGIVAWRDQ